MFLECDVAKLKLKPSVDNLNSLPSYIHPTAFTTAAARSREVIFTDRVQTADHSDRDLAIYERILTLVYKTTYKTLSDTGAS